MSIDFHITEKTITPSHPSASDVATTTGAKLETTDKGTTGTKDKGIHPKKKNTKTSSLLSTSPDGQLCNFRCTFIA